MKNKIRNMLHRFTRDSLVQCEPNRSGLNLTPEKFIFYFVVGVIFVIAFIMRFTLFNVPFSGTDTVGYIGVAFQYFSKGIFYGIAERSYPYPLFLTVILGLFKNVSAITVIQHILGMVAGVFFLRIWYLVDSMFLSLSGVCKYFYWIVGIIGLYMLMCSEWSVYIEHSSHPESLTSFLIASLILVYLELYKLCSNRSSFVLIVFYALASFLLNYLIFKYQPRYGLNLIVVFCVFCVILFKHLDKKKSILIIVLSIVSTYIFLILPFQHFDNRDLVKVNRTAAFFFFNLKTIAPIIKEDLNNKEIDAKKKILLHNILTDLTKAEDPNNNYATGFSKSLGLNTDYFDRTYYAVLNYGNSYSDAANFYISYVKRAIISHPILLMAKIVKEFFYFYFNDAGFASQQSAWIDSYNSIKTFPGIFPNVEILSNYLNSLKFISENSVQSKPFGAIYSSVAHISVTVKKLLPITIILFIILFAMNFKWKNKYYKFGLFVFTLMMLQFGFNATISIANSTSVVRYISDQMLAIMLFEFFALVFIVFCVAWLFQDKLLKR